MAAGFVLAGLQVISGLHQAEMVRTQSQLTRAINDLNAQYAEMDAWEAEKYGYTQSARYQKQVDALIGDQRVGYAAQGVDVNSGTAKEIQEESKLIGFLNTLDIQNQARAKAMGLKVQASNLRLGSFMSGMQAESTARGAAIGGLLQGAGTAISTYRGTTGYKETKETT